MSIYFPEDIEESETNALGEYSKCYKFLDSKHVLVEPLMKVLEERNEDNFPSNFNIEEIKIVAKSWPTEENILFHYKFTLCNHRGSRISHFSTPYTPLFPDIWMTLNNLGKRKFLAKFNLPPFKGTTPIRRDFWIRVEEEIKEKG